MSGMFWWWQMFWIWRRGKHWVESWLAVLGDWHFARVECFANLIQNRMEGEIDVMNLVENNYAVIESWGVVIADQTKYGDRKDHNTKLFMWDLSIPEPNSKTSQKIWSSMPCCRKSVQVSDTPPHHIFPLFRKVSLHIYKKWGEFCISFIQHLILWCLIFCHTNPKYSPQNLGEIGSRSAAASGLKQNGFSACNILSFIPKK